MKKMKKIHLWYYFQKCNYVSFVSLYGLIVPEQFDFLNEQTVPEYALSNFISTNSMKIYVSSLQKQEPLPPMGYKTQTAAGAV